MAYMLGISNIVQGETRYIDDSPTKIESHDQTLNDEPFDEAIKDLKK